MDIISIKIKYRIKWSFRGFIAQKKYHFSYHEFKLII